MVIAALVGGVSVYSYLRFGKKWVNVKDIPEEEILKVADKVVSKRIEEAEKEIEENKRKAEEHLRELRKEAQEHEELLLEREKKLNEELECLIKRVRSWRWHLNH